MPVLVIFNPVSGDRSARTLFDDHVLPLLAHHNVVPDNVVHTQHPDHAGPILFDFLHSTRVPDHLSVILGSGDGTLHELINFLNSQPTTIPLPRIRIALVPCGTANALYSSLFPPSPDDDPVHHRLKSLHAFLSANHASLPLNLAVSVLSGPPVTSPGLPPAPKQISISAVVTSTALHASILHDSEALRASDPTMDRFKTAAAQNITRWYSASVKLYPSQSTGVVQVYDPPTNTWVTHQQTTDDDPILDLNGPFAYFLSTVNVDRLEPQFRISPRGRDVLTPKDGSAVLYVVIVRPMRDPTFQMDSESTRVAFAEKAAAVLGAAYRDGAHIALRYDQNGKVVADGDGPTVVEYLRCGAWEWEPDVTDARAHFVCADGEILLIPNGGKVTCTAATPMSDTTGFSLYV
ncbi:ATP-NAD kinase-like domain-containing protein [Ganoderma leucocontextum]|nr:ATP-NAD kinase-like domain-containing protein [Ganoderma leucocontextum]